jgi:hypothetical protein
MDLSISNPCTGFDGDVKLVIVELRAVIAGLQPVSTTQDVPCTCDAGTDFVEQECTSAALTCPGWSYTWNVNGVSQTETSGVLNLPSGSFSASDLVTCALNPAGGGSAVVIASGILTSFSDLI